MSRQRTKYGHSIAMHVRVPLAIFKRIEAQSKTSGVPMNKIIIDALEEVPTLERYRDLFSALERLEKIVSEVEIFRREYSLNLLQLDRQPRNR